LSAALRFIITSLTCNSASSCWFVRHASTNAVASIGAALSAVIRITG
jgi:hypothetical protein